MFALLYLHQSFPPHGLTITLSLLSLVFAIPALSFKVHDTNLIYPDCIGQQASGNYMLQATSTYS